MRRIRIGNQISFQWTILNGDVAYDLTARNCQVFIVAAMIKQQVAFTLSGENHNIVNITWTGAEQKYCGEYHLLLISNENQENMFSLDSKPCVVLTPVTEHDAMNTAVTVELTDNIYMPTSGESLYEMMVRTGRFEGTEEEFLQQYQDTLTAANTAATNADNARIALTERADADHTQAGNDHTRANNDHNTAVDDHTQAGNDHTRANTDHNTAVDDHTQAGNDHTQAGNDHTRANTDHNTASDDHTRANTDHNTAADDHTQAGSDHTRAGSDHNTAADDHTQAGSDHTRAGTDHSTASDDHTQAGNDHTRANTDHNTASDDHTRANSDHNAAIVGMAIDYAEGESGTTPPESGWQTTIPEVSGNNFLWTRNTITLGSGSTQVYYNVSMVPVVSMSQETEDDEYQSKFFAGEQQLGEIDIVDNDTSEAADKALSANQGRVLAERVSAIENNRLFIMPTGLQVESPTSLTVGNIHEHFMKAKILPASAYQNVIYIADNKAVSVEPDGRILINGVGHSLVHVVPLANPGLYKTVGITVHQPYMRKTAVNTLRFMSDGTLSLT